MATHHPAEGEIFQSSSTKVINILSHKMMDIICFYEKIYSSRLFLEYINAVIY